MESGPGQTRKKMEKRKGINVYLPIIFSFSKSFMYRYTDMLKNIEKFYFRLRIFSNIKFCKFQILFRSTSNQNMHSIYSFSSKASSLNACKKVPLRKKGSEGVCFSPHKHFKHNISIQYLDGPQNRKSSPWMPN